MNDYRVSLTSRVLDDAAQFFMDQGSQGYEGTGLIACRPYDDRWISARFVAPDQVAHRRNGGCAVEVTEQGKNELLTALKAGERYLVRIHSHPGEAFHSVTDDRNPALTHAGALSIVVPFFGLGLRRGLDACAVLRLSDSRWRSVAPGPARDQWVTISE